MRCGYIIPPSLSLTHAVEIKQKRAKLFKKEILEPEINNEQEKRVDLSEEYESSNVSELNDSERVPDIDDENGNRKSISGSSTSSVVKDKQSVATGQPGRFLKGIEESEIEKPARAESDITSTIRGAFNQISSIVEAQDFKFNKNKVRRVQNEKLGNAKSRKLNFNNTQEDNRIFNKVLPNNKELYSPQYAAFTNNEKRKLRKLERQKMKSEACDEFYNPYQLKPNQYTGRAASENKNINNFDFEQSSESFRRREFNHEIEVPQNSSRL